MTHSSRLIFPSASLIVLLLLATISSGFSQETTALDTQPLTAFLKGQKSIKSLTADFVQERQLPSLNHPLKSRGRMWVKHPDYFRWEIGTPAQSVLLRNPKSLLLVDVEQQVIKELDAKSKRASQFMVMLSKMPATLEAFENQFEIRSTTQQDTIYKITLSPKQRRMRAHVPWLILHIDTNTHQLSGFELFTKDQAVIRTFFGKVTINPAIDPKQFEFDQTGYQVEK